LDDLLAEDGSLEEVSARALKRVLSWQVQQGMKKRGLTKVDMAKRMRTSRSALDRLLDESDIGLTIDTLTRAARALGYKIKLELKAA
jgi:transcriptional regulator with XRE-family HTH domain